MKYRGLQGAAADAHIHYYRPALLNERMNAYISERKIGKRLGSYLVEIKNEAGILLAETMITVSFKS